MNEPARRPQPSPVVLVVEDEADVCELISDVLASGGFEVMCAQTDAEALEKLRSTTAYQCLVLDVNLRQGLTGFDVARFASNLMPRVPILFVSGEASRQSVESHGVPGASFLAKPFTADQLLANVSALARGDATS